MRVLIMLAMSALAGCDWLASHDPVVLSVQRVSHPLEIMAGDSLPIQLQIGHGACDRNVRLEATPTAGGVKLVARAERGRGLCEAILLLREERYVVPPPIAGPTFTISIENYQGDTYVDTVHVVANRPTATAQPVFNINLPGSIRLSGRTALNGTHITATLLLHNEGADTARITHGVPGCSLGIRAYIDAARTEPTYYYSRLPRNTACPLAGYFMRIPPGRTDSLQTAAVIGSEEFPAPPAGGYLMGIAVRPGGALQIIPAGHLYLTR